MTSVPMEVDWFLQHADWWHVATIPIFTGVVGWLINWTGLIMLFSPLRFRGVRVPGLRGIGRALPRKVREVPGIDRGAVGWQGIIPMRSAKMGSVAVDKVIAKLGTPADFYAELEPELIAEHILKVFEPELPALVDRVMHEQHPRLWRDLPRSARTTIVNRVQSRLPNIVHNITDEIGEHINQLLDPKLMVIDQFERNPELVVEVFRGVGRRELKLMVNFGFIFGFLLGIPVALADHWFAQWWLLPGLGVLVGWVTNLLGMWLIFEPSSPRRILGIRMHGLFPRRQDEASEAYAEIIARDVITLERIGDFLIDGPRGDRTRRLLENALRPAIDQASGPLLPAIRLAVGQRRYDLIRESVTQEAVGRTLTPFRDKDFSQRQGKHIQRLLAERAKALPGEDFVEMMRSAFREDEWMLYFHGAVMGMAGGLLHLWIFGVGS